MSVEDCNRCRWWNQQGLSQRCPPCDAEWLDRFEAKLIASQEPLGAEFQKVLDDNLWDLCATPQREGPAELDPPEPTDEQWKNSKTRRLTPEGWKDV